VATWEKITSGAPASVGVSAIRSVQATTDSAPTLDSDGYSLAHVKGFALIVECDVGQTFASSAGQIDLYHADPSILDGWSHLVDREVLVPPSAIGLSKFTLLFEVVSSRGRVAFICNGLAVTGGGITLTIVGNLK
jgi:hypothetical protein